MLKENAASATELATALARDKKFRKEVLSAAGHGVIARRRAARRIGFLAAVSRLTADPKLKRELRRMTRNLDKAWSRIEKKRSHKLRNSLLVAAGAGGVVAAAVPLRRKFASSGLPKVVGGPIPRMIDESIEVGVPVSTAYNQWTQLEDFPLFMKASTTSSSWTTPGCTGRRRSPARRRNGTRRFSSSIRTGRSAGSAKTARRHAARSRSNRAVTRGHPCVCR